ncbi:unnamed protein product [Mesocestoides corti]|uniref:Rab-GAP TBC domain-containing protein n=1 Tax=Mesocestoides corti TaxID=53468 RepID=A0A0R3UL79_MESCO|nr:unnamed protein product [Mesocestoides corti]
MDGPSSLTNQFVQLFKLIEILMPRFAHFLRKMEATSMNFCFKWFLIIFKREFSYDDIKILWEALWSDSAPKNFQLLIAVAIFDAEADSIMRSCSDISQILQYINGLSEKINLQMVLSRAQGIYNQLTEVKDRLPSEVAITLGFVPAPSSASDGDYRGDSDFLPVDDCDFILETATSQMVDAEVGEEATDQDGSYANYSAGESPTDTFL